MDFWFVEFRVGVGFGVDSAEGFDASDFASDGAANVLRPLGEGGGGREVGLVPVLVGGRCREADECV